MDRSVRIVMKQIMEYRKLLPQEERLLEVLTKRGSIPNLPSDWKANLFVKSMTDGEMGSLLLFPHGPTQKDRVFGRQASEIEFEDKDGIRVIASLNLDAAGELFELDMWKTDYSPLIYIPENLG